jgi:FAD/FMN-containing dehydrogenase
MQGAVLHPGAPGYDQARTVWNAMIDNRPRVIVQPRSVTDVAIAVRWAVDHDLSIGIKCGGHNVVGHAVPDDGLMIDLTGMGAVRASPMVRRAWVEGGALLGALDRATQPFGMATTAGNVSHTGVGGLTLGGGMGWLARQFGLACDNVLSYDVVTADGRLTRASAHQNADLFWALKGGGGNFGVVTEFEFALHKVDGPTLAVEMDFPVQVGAAVLRGWRDLNAEAPRQATFTAEIGGGMVTVGYVWVGAPDEGRQWASRLRSISKPAAERIVEASYLELQTRADVIGGHAKRRYTKNQFISVLSDAAIEKMLEGADSPEFPGAGLQAYGGAIADVPDEATAFSHRNTKFDFTTGAAWLDPSEDQARITAARAYAESMRPFTSGVYANSPGEEDASWVARSFSADKVARLRAIKSAYDPDNRFCHNANVRPADDGKAAARPTIVDGNPGR